MKTPPGKPLIFTPVHHVNGEKCSGSGQPLVNGHCPSKECGRLTVAEIEVQDNELPERRVFYKIVREGRQN